ncbi:MAG: hypothetical protein QOJ52_1528 [Acidimicrobiaceae bacterium]|nr:hypothetical protein [Acidimicrobiaceae bacterium]
MAKKRSGEKAPPGAGQAAPEGAHEWVSFPDPSEERTWVFDVTFLLSGWHCIYGAGCQGVLTGPAPELEQGCCSYGAHFTDDSDVERVRVAASSLTAAQWQFRRRGQRSGTVRSEADGTVVTRLVDGACIFLNRPGFEGGAGCALHRAALEGGGRPMDLKPDVCWQLPLRREDTTDERGRVTSTVTQWDRRHWGDGGDEFHWWCTSAPDAFGGRKPVYRAMRDELVELCGAAVYDLLAGYLDARGGTGRGGARSLPAASAGGASAGAASSAGSVAGSVPLPHPAVRGARSVRSPSP